jgi:hypothetical protein
LDRDIREKLKSVVQQSFDAAQGANPSRWYRISAYWMLSAWEPHTANPNSFSSAEFAHVFI